MLVKVNMGDKCFQVPITVIKVKSDFRPLIGLSWLNKFNSNWRKVFYNKLTKNHKGIDFNLVDDIQNLTLNVKSMFCQTCSETKGKIKGYTVDIKLKENVACIFKKAYDILYATKEVIKSELDKLLQEEVIFEVSHSKRASPIVPVFKNSGQVRICVDLKTQ